MACWVFTLAFTGVPVRSQETGIMISGQLDQATYEAFVSMLESQTDGHLYYQPM